MGFLQTQESKRMEIEELRRILVACASVNRRKDDEELRGRVRMDDDERRRDMVVCVTSGVSFFGLAIVNRLLLRGYSVRIIVDNQEDIEKLREMKSSGEMETYNNNLEVVTAKLNEVEDMVEAFEGCRGIFHTSAFVDPVGLSGYSKCMAELEVKATESVLKACARTSSVRKCVLTSSLLACIWREDLSQVVNQDCWSNESLCINKKLWYALGKLRSEKTAWQIAEEGRLKLATICPGLITGPEFFQRNPTATIAYLKGGKKINTRPSKRFEGKVAIVTASTQGIGFSIAERLGFEGASVVVSSRKQKNVDEAVENLKAKGIEVFGVVCHVSNAQQRKNLIDKTVQKYGKIDVVVSNAAANPSVDNILETKESVLDKLWEINVKSAILVLQDAAPHLQKGSSVVLVSSIAGYQPQGSMAMYGVTKTALLGLTKALAAEMAPDTRVNCIAPGFVPTHFANFITSNPTVRKAIEEKTLLNRLGTTDDMAAATAFLASDDAAYITGETLVVAGGIPSRL